MFVLIFDEIVDHQIMLYSRHRKGSYHHQQSDLLFYILLIAGWCTEIDYSSVMVVVYLGFDSYLTAFIPKLAASIILYAKSDFVVIVDRLFPACDNYSTLIELIT